MKRIAENRYPHSATLFKFCKEALSLQYQDKVKVIDQDVGAILSYDPADCSHWKKGKKNIRSLNIFKNLAEYLHMDEHLLVGISTGKVNLDEAVFEYKGYGNFSLRRVLENEEKELEWDEKKILSERQNIINGANVLLERTGIEKTPVDLLKVLEALENVEHIVDPKLKLDIISECANTPTGLQLIIKTREDMDRCFVKFLIAKEIFLFLCKTDHSYFVSLASISPVIMEIFSNIFAAAVLIPEKSLEEEVSKVDSSYDLIGQISEKFCVSRALANKRLTEYMKRV